MALAGMPIGRPSDKDPEAWFRLAVQMDQNQAADDAFHSRVPTTAFMAAPPCDPSPAPIETHAHYDACQMDANELLKVLESKLVEEGQPINKFCTPHRIARAKPALVHITPLLPDNNQFSVLEVPEPDTAPELEDALRENPKVQPPPTVELRRLRQPKWERCMTHKLIICSGEKDPRCIMVPIHLKMTDTMEEASTEAMVDTGATGDFVDQDFVNQAKLPTRKLSQPIPIYNVDGTLNEAGSIREVVDMIMTYDGHSERILLAITRLGKQSMILGMTWLNKHNPEIDFRAGTVKMTRCLPHCCVACRSERRDERKAEKRDTQKVNACCTGPLPAFVEDADDEEDETDGEPEGPAKEPLEEGDRIWATGLLPKPEYIRATATVSQRLAQAFEANTEPTDILPYLREFHSVFSKESFDDLPESRPWDHAVELQPDATPKGCKVYPLSAFEQKELDAFLKENLESGRIRPSKSPMASPVFFVKKKDGALRLVQDYRALNAMTVKNKYPLLLIPELIAKLRRAKYFTKLDVRWGFNNVCMKEGDEWKAAFRTNRGLFEPLIMFFGLTNSPATFQTMMNDIFKELITEGHVVVYLDDILIFTKMIDKHRAITQRVLEILQKHKLYLRADKCEFEKTTVEYLWVIISHNSVAMDSVKIAGVAEWPTPTSKKEVQSFLGFTNFYRRFIKGFSEHACPLFDLTWNDCVWRWKATEQAAFEKLKESVTSAPVLISPDSTRPFCIEADSSDFATGAVLSQLSAEDEKWHPVAFLSKSLSLVERNYEIHDKEMLAIIRSLQEWRHFVEGADHPCEILTDHKNLEYFMTAKQLNRRQARWSLYLSRFNFTLCHRPGKSMGKPDALSH